jgi:hypothetical protein
MRTSRKRRRKRKRPSRTSRPRRRRPPASTRPEEAASEARAILRGERPTPDFTHVHAGVPQGDEHPELGRKCRSEPFRPGTFKNTFRDDGRAFAGDTRIDKKLTRRLRPTGRRPEVRKVKVHCVKCERDFRVEPAFAPKVIKEAGDADGRTMYVCDECMRRGK